MSMQPGGMLPSLEPQGPDSKRLMITMLMVTAMWVVFQVVFPPETPKPAAESPVATAAAPAELNAAPAAAPGAVAATPDAPEQTQTVHVDVAANTGAQATPGESIAVRGGYAATLTTRGAQITSFVLDGYKDPKRTNTDGSPAAIDLAAAEFAGARSYAVRSVQGDVKLAADASYVVSKNEPRALSFERLTDSGVRVTRNYSFEDKRFAFAHELVLKNESTERRTAKLEVVLTGLERAGERDEGGMFSPVPDQLAGACRVADSREHFTSTDAEKKPHVYDGSVTYAALDRHYFLAGLTFEGIPTGRCRVEAFTQAAVAQAAGGDGVSVAHGFQIVVEQLEVSLAPGEVKSFASQAYYGPKQVGLLADFGHQLSDNIDFGIFGIISRPMLWVLVKLHGVTGNFGIAIILLTFLMKLLTFPLTQKAYVGMQQMKKVAPELKELQKKHGHDRAVMGQKQMELYQQKGINPLAGCLPMLIQMPIWFALYRTLSQAVELYQQPFIAQIVDLTQPDKLLPFGISFLPLIVGALMIWQTALQPPPEDQPQMKYVLWLMPFMFTILMLSMASGLSIYMITNSLLTMAQQYYIKRRYA